MRALDCRTWGQQVYLYRVLSRLLEQGRIHKVQDNRRGGQQILYAGSPDRTNWQHSLGAADLKIGVACSCRALGYEYCWSSANLKAITGSAADGLLIFEKLDADGARTRRLVIMEYQRTKLSCQRAAEKLRRYTSLEDELQRAFDVTHVYILASFDLWPLGYSERWLEALVREVADCNLYVTSHVRLLDVPAPDILTASIWYRYGNDGLVPIFLKE